MASPPPCDYHRPATHATESKQAPDKQPQPQSQHVGPTTTTTSQRQSSRLSVCAITNQIAVSTRPAAAQTARLTSAKHARHTSHRSTSQGRPSCEQQDQATGDFRAQPSSASQVQHHTGAPTADRAVARQFRRPRRATYIRTAQVSRNSRSTRPSPKPTGMKPGSMTGDSIKPSSIRRSEKPLQSRMFSHIREHMSPESMLPRRSRRSNRSRSPVLSATPICRPHRSPSCDILHRSAPARRISPASSAPRSAAAGQVGKVALRRISSPRDHRFDKSARASAISGSRRTRPTILASAATRPRLTLLLNAGRDARLAATWHAAT